MFDEEDREIGYALFIAIGVAILVSIFTIGIAAGSAIGRIGQKPAAAASGALPIAAAPAAGAVAVVEAVRIYFELGKAELPADAQSRLDALFVTGTHKHATWVVSGYHDASGDTAANAELAKQRAFAVRDLLVARGVSPQSIELSKPIVTLGGTDPREARRVEVTLR
ncbi:MAG TPA: OmpA family protein [Burkholderiaceae bacterium]|nr:OmpA family protein [Burkholderiaceae bacterium]